MDSLNALGERKVIDTSNFDEATIGWPPFPGPDGSSAHPIACSILNVDDDVLILFSLRPYSADDPIYEILDDS